MKQRRQKTKKGSRKILLLLMILFIGICVWKGIRATSTVPFRNYTETAASSYSEKEKILKAMSLSYFVYGCETCEELSGTISELLEQHEMGILVENFGIKRRNQQDPTTAIFDSSQFVRQQTGDFRVLTALNEPSSSFYGAAFCDDKNKCVWISYSGTVALKDCVACAELVLAPGLSTQEKSAFELFDTVMESDEVCKQSYSVIVTGHSLGGAFASMISRMSGCEAVTINGADGFAIDKMNGIVGEKPATYRISNYMTSPKKEKLSFMKLVQSLMFLGSYKDVNCHVYSPNGLTTDTHCVFSFVVFPEEDYSSPEIPDVLLH